MQAWQDDATEPGVWRYRWVRIAAGERDRRLPYLTRGEMDPWYASLVASLPPVPRADGVLVPPEPRAAGSPPYEILSEGASWEAEEPGEVPVSEEAGAPGLARPGGEPAERGGFAWVAREDLPAGCPYPYRVMPVPLADYRSGRWLAPDYLPSVPLPAPYGAVAWRCGVEATGPTKPKSIDKTRRPYETQQAPPSLAEAWEEVNRTTTVGLLSDYWWVDQREMPVGCPYPWLTFPVPLEDYRSGRWLEPDWIPSRRLPAPHDQVPWQCSVPSLTGTPHRGTFDWPESEPPKDVLPGAAPKQRSLDDMSLEELRHLEALYEWLASRAPGGMRDRAKRRLVDLRAAVGRREQSLRDARRLLERASETGLAAQGLATLLRLSVDIAYLLRTPDLNPTSRHRYVRAAARLEEELRARVEEPGRLGALGAVERRRAELEARADALRGAIDEDPEDADARAELRRVEEELGQLPTVEPAEPQPSPSREEERKRARIEDLRRKVEDATRAVQRATGLQEVQVALDRLTRLHDQLSRLGGLEGYAATVPYPPTGDQARARSAPPWPPPIPRAVPPRAAAPTLDFTDDDTQTPPDAPTSGSYVIPDGFETEYLPLEMEGQVFLVTADGRVLQLDGASAVRMRRMLANPDAYVVRRGDKQGLPVNGLGGEWRPDLRIAREVARTVGRVLQDLGLLGLVERVTNYLAHPLARPIVTMWIRGEAPSAEELREIVADSAIDLATGKLLPGRPGVGGPKRKALAPDAPDATPHRPTGVPEPPPTVPAKSPPRLGEPHPGAVPESVTVEAPRHPAAAPDATRQIPGSSPGGTRGGERSAPLQSGRTASRVDPGIPTDADGWPLINGRRPINYDRAGKVVDGVEWTSDGFPVFTPHAKHRRTFDGLTGGADDFDRANRAFGYDRTPKSWTWHHVEDGRTIELIPTDLHRANRHTGGAAVLEHLRKSGAR